MRTILNIRTITKIFTSTVFLVTVIITVSAFTHIWNPIGFPSLIHDESIYLRRTMQVVGGSGPQEPVEYSDHAYDHPYFGQIFLAAIFSVVGYPEVLDLSSGSIQSVELLYLIPRVLIGLLAIADTLLIYKISEMRYNRKIAFIASILFAVMPLTWLTRRILLDSLMLPFILSSILFAVYYNKKIKIQSTSSKMLIDRTENKLSDPRTVLILISGIFLGLAIFTKIPAFCMIPLLGYIIIWTGNNKKSDQNIHIKNIKGLRPFGLWLIPVIFIPMIWPAYSISAGEFDNWLNDVFWQEERGGQGVSSIKGIYNMDPVLVVLGFSGLFFAAIRRDMFIFLWIIPFLIFLEFSGWVLVYHYIIFIPGLCIASAALLGDLVKEIRVKIIKRKNSQSQSTISEYFEHSENKSLIPYDKPLAILAAGVAIFGLTITVFLVTSDLNSTYFEVIAFIIQLLPTNEDNEDDKKVTLILHSNTRDLMWIPKYVFDKDYEYRANYRAPLISWETPVNTRKVIMLDEKWLMSDITMNSTKKGNISLRMLYNNTEPIKIFEEKRHYKQFPIPPFNINIRENRGIGETTEIRTNY
jgi:4-amino-4-deoxy-L-arabinose transferase-like glycosyltransferase